MDINTRVRIVASSFILLTIAGSSFVESQVSRIKPLATTVSSGRFVINFKETPAGFLATYEGGDVRGEVGELKAGGSPAIKKQITRVTVAPLEMEFGLGSGEPLIDWMIETINGNASRRDGSVISGDYKLNAVSKLAFKSALIQEVTFPDLDGSSKIAGRISMKVALGGAQRQPASGPVSGPPLKSAKVWNVSNFKVSIPGIDTSRVRKVESFTIKQSITQFRSGGDRMTSIAPGRLEIPNLVLVVPEAFAKGFYDWHEDFVVAGHSADSNEKTLTLTLTAPAGEALFTLKFSNVGILSVTPVRAEAASEGLRTVRVELYAEKLEASAP